MPKCKGLKFGDVVENGWSGDENPHKRGFFVRYVTRRRVPCAQCTDGKGSFWDTVNDSEGKITKISDSAITTPIGR